MKFFSRSILPVAAFLLFTQFIFADPPNWTDNPGAYEFTATISGGIILNEGQQMGDDGDLFSAFDEDGNVRGLGLMLFPPFGPYQGTPVFEVQLRSNAAGDLLSFKYYDASEDAILDVVETYEFVINDILGDVINPISFNIQQDDNNAPDWVDCPGCYEFTATISGGIILDESGEQMGDDGDMFAAFDEDGNVRGIGLMLFPPFGPYQGTPVFEVQLRSNAEGDLLHFKYYDASEDAILDVVETYEFVINDILGDVLNPIFFNIGSGDEECVDDDVAVAPFDCATAVANFGCDMAWGGSTIGELCPVSCDACPVYGCMDDVACNYNADATDNDGSCTYAEENYDCDGNCTAAVDCADECGGSSEVDECGVCGGDGSSCASSIIDILYNTTSDIGGFQFNVDGVTVVGASGGAAADSGFTISTGGSIVLAFSFAGATIPAGSGVLVQVDVQGDVNAACIYDVVLSDAVGAAIDNEVTDCLTISQVETIWGCTDELACNYNVDATVDDGSCLENDCADECGGSSEVDECGVCGGSGIPDGDCDCNGNQDLGCGCGEAGPSGCDNACGSTLENDECGVCGGSGIPDGDCDCDGNVEDECGVCGGDGSSCGGSIDYCLNLHEGKNLISFYALPDDVSITHVMYSIEGNATGVIGEGVAANYNGIDWTGSLNTISSLSGYWVIVSEVDSLCIEDGIPTDPAIQYSLHSGANLISFPIEGSVEISSSLPDDIEGSVSGIIGEGVAANNQPPWQGSLSALSGGNGYWMITTDDISFSFDVSTMSRIKFDDEVGLTAPDNKAIHQSTQQAFYFIGDITLDGMPVSDGDWILTYNGKTLVGARQWNGAFTDVPAMGYDGAFETEGYSKNGGVLTFKVQRNTTGKIYQIMDAVPAWKSNEIFTLGQLSAREIPDEVLLVSAYPNPFNPVTNITFGIENDAVVMAKVFDVTGREVAELANGVYSAGYHVVDWNADSHSSGLYFLTITVDGFTSGNGQHSVQTQKLMLLK